MDNICRPYIFLSFGSSEMLVLIYFRYIFLPPPCLYNLFNYPSCVTLNPAENNINMHTVTMQQSLPYCQLKTTFSIFVCPFCFKMQTVLTQVDLCFNSTHPTQQGYWLLPLTLTGTYLITAILHSSLDLPKTSRDNHMVLFVKNYSCDKKSILATRNQFL